MPRAKSSVNLSTDDLRRFIAGENGEIRAKLVEWARRELIRRELAGSRGGRTKGRPEPSKEITYERDDYVQE